MRSTLLLPALLLSSPAWADDAPSAIIVTGRALGAPPGAAAYSTQVILRERLLESASGRIEDALRDVAGFQQFRRTNSTTANPTTQGATLRGIGGNASSRALVLLDGVPVGDPFAGYIPFSALAPERLAYARVTRGGGVGPFGAGAVAGVIELESAARGDSAPAYLRALHGSRDSAEIAAGIAPRLGDGFVTLDGRYDSGDGYVIVPRMQRGPADIAARYEQWSAALRAVVPVGANTELQTRFALFHDARLRGLRGTDSRSEGGDASARLISRGRWAIDALGYLQVRNFASGFVAIDAARTAGTPTLDQFRTPAIGAGGKIEVRPPVGGGHILRIGVDGRHADGATNERFRFVAGAFTRLRRAGGAQDQFGLFVEDDWTLGRLTLTAGARADRWAQRAGRLTEIDPVTGATTLGLAFADRDGWEPSVRGGARYAITPALALRGAGYTGWRLPTLNELYRPFRVGADATAANPALGNERVRGGDVGFDFQPIPGWRLSATGFYNALDDAVANVTLGRGPGVFPQVGFVAAGGAFRQRGNLDSIEAKGAEVEASARRGILDARLSYAWTDSRVRASGAAAGLDGLRPANTPPQQLSATLGVRPRRGDLALTVRHASGQWEDDLNTRRLPAATTLDAFAAIRLTRGVRLIGRAENLADERVISGIAANGVIDLGAPRTLWIGVDVGLGR